MTETVDMSGVKPSENGMAIHVSELPYMPKEAGDNYAYVMLMKNGEIISEPHIPVHYAVNKDVDAVDSKDFYEKGIVTESKADDEKALSATTCISKDKESGYWIYIAKSLNLITTLRLSKKRKMKQIILNLEKIETCKIYF